MNFSFGEEENVEIVEMEDDSLCRQKSHGIEILPLREKKEVYRQSFISIQF